MVAPYNAVVLLLFLALFRVGPQRSRRVDRIYLVVACSALMLLSAVRFEDRGDFASNLLTWERIGRLPFRAVFAEEDPGAALFRWIVARFTDDGQWFFAVSAIIIVGSVGVFIWRYSRDVYLSVYLFVTLGLYFSSHNIMLQYVSSAIWLWSVPFLIRRNLFAYLSVCLVAASIHTSAVVLLPLYWLAKIPIRPRVLVAYALATTAAYVWFSRALGVIQTFIYQDYSSESYGMTPAHPLNVALPFALVVIVLWNASPMRNNHSAVVDPADSARSDSESLLENTLIHASVLSLVFSLLGVAHALIIERGAHHFMLAFIILIPNLISRVASQKRLGLYLGLVILAGVNFIVRNALGDFTPTPYLPFWEYR